MSEIAVLVEHRLGEIRDITFEMLAKANQLAEKSGYRTTAIMIGKGVEDLAGKLKGYCDRLLLVEDESMKFFVSDAYQKVLEDIVRERRPRLLLIGHTSYGLELAPSLAASLNIPLITGCTDITLDEGVEVVRPVYGGKLLARVEVNYPGTVILTLSQGVVKPFNPGKETEIIRKSVDVGRPGSKVFLEYVMPEEGEVDISSADVIVAVGRGIQDKSNIPQAEELAKALGGVLACSRPIVDKGWLPQDRQVGSSGKTVKPKLYLALGISGAFQHIQGMKDSQLIIAVNKDPNAPIFNVAHYGVVEDLFRIVPVLIEKVREARGGG